MIYIIGVNHEMQYWTGSDEIGFGNGKLVLRQPQINGAEFADI